MEIHDAANIFPLDEESIPGLAEDIRKNGQQVPVELCGGKVIDGRRRLRACELAGVEPQFKDVTPTDPVAYVLSLNLHRRHLTPSQLSMVGARAREVYDKAAKERQKASGGDRKSGRKSVPANLPEPIKADARDAVGKAVGVSGRTIDYATKILERGVPELIAAVDEGRMAVSTAVILASEPEETQRAESARLPSGKPRTRKYKPGSGGTAPDRQEEPDDEATEAPEPGKLLGVGVFRANDAINCLTRIPKNDGLRQQGFKLVTDWIRRNK